MTDEQKLATVIAAAAVLNARVAGMVAENDYRKQRGETVAYTSEEFEDVIKESGLHYNVVASLFGESV